MSTLSWTRLKAEAVSQLAAACPSLGANRSDLAALASLVALAGAKLSARTVPGTVEPALVVSPKPKADAPAAALLAMITDTEFMRVSRSHPEISKAFGGWVQENGYSAVTRALVTSEAGRAELSVVAEIIAGAIRALSKRASKLGLQHMESVLERDLPAGLLCCRLWLKTAAAWLLAPEARGEPRRAEILERRVQAMTVYGALSRTLYEPDITRAIDDGKALAPLLMQRHDLSAAELRALRGARRFRHALDTATDFHVAVQELKAHEVPLHEWPGAGRPGQTHAWERSVWTVGTVQHMVRPDYVGSSAQSVKDAMDALRADLLQPLVAERIRTRALPLDHRILNFARTVALNTSEGSRTARRRLLGALRHAIVGPRRSKAFQEGVGLWHRRVASLSALRHERAADRPGWPPLCSPWRSQCRRFEIVVLSSAADLVEEGRILDHCVGGYYDICRRGDTQILSLREDGRRVATVELKLGLYPAALTIEVGQFSSHRNSRPARHLHEPLREFLRDIRVGAHAVDTGRLARYRKRMRDTWDGGWRSDALPIAHAREVFPFYLPLLPRGTPATFDAWCEQTGLSDAIDETLAHVISSPSKG